MTPVCEFLQGESVRVTPANGLDYLEIGVQEGYSLQSVLRNEHVRLAVGVDTWGDGYGGTGRGSPDHVAQLLGEDMRRVVLVTGDSKVILPGLCHRFDMVFIDGDHSEEGCLADLNNCQHLLKPSTLVLVDDLKHPTHSYLYAAVEKWAAEHGFEFSYIPVGYGLGRLWKK